MISLIEHKLLWRNQHCSRCVIMVLPEVQGLNLVIKIQETQPIFLDASQYPACDYVRPLKSSADGACCELSGGGRFALHVAQIWCLRQGRFGMFIGCSITLP